MLLIIVTIGPPVCSCLFILIAMPATAAAAAAAEAEVGAVVADELLPAVEQPAVAAPIIDEFNNICIKS